MIRLSQVTFTPEVKAVLLAAQDEARAMGHGYIGTEHVLIALLGDDEVRAALPGATVDGARAAAHEAFAAAASPNRFIPDDDVLATIGVDAAAVRARVEAVHGAGSVDTRSGAPPFTGRMGAILEVAVALAAAAARDQATVADVVDAIRADAECVAARYLATVG